MQLSLPLQQDVLVLCAFDDVRAPIIRGVASLDLFGGPYRVIIECVYNYIDRFKRAPGLHLPNLITHKLEGPNTSEATLYSGVLDQIHDAKDRMQAEYVMSQLENFIQQRSLIQTAVKISQALNRNTEASLEEAKQLLASANHVTLSVFDPGTYLSDKSRALAFLDLPTASLPTGIPDLDKRGFGPTKRELFLGIANAKAGKTWLLIHLAKMAMLSRMRVLHLSLEMSESRSAGRYYQTLFGMAKRGEKLPVHRFKLTPDDKIAGFELREITPKIVQEHPEVRKLLERKIEQWTYRGLNNILIKEFPTGQLTIRQLTAYLDNLHASENFLPDVMIVDYPDLMKIGKKDYRLSLDELYKDLRGLAVARNMAVVAVSQSHRGAAKAKQVGIHNVAEAYSKIAHADVIITYSQTDQEKKMGLGRLHVTGRNDSDGFSVVITQQYGIGSFVIDSHLMSSGYFGLFPEEDAM